MDKLQRLSKRKFLALDFPASRARIFLEFLKKIAVSVRFLIFSAYYIVMKEKFYRAGYFAAGCIRSVLSYSFARESCISCSRPVVSVPLCRKCLDECMSAFESDFSKRCSVCGKELLGELKICMKCRTENLFSQVDQVLPMFPYRLWMKKLIFEWKMDGRRSLSTLFASVLDVVNNETGAIQPVKEIASALTEKCRGKRKPFFHTDCVQAAGKIRLDLEGWGVDSAAFSAHKIGGPRGIGLLYLSKQIVPFLRGGGQEKGTRSGTENLLGAAALSLCLEKYLIRNENRESTERLEKQKEMTGKFMRGLLEIKGCTTIPHCRSGEEFAENFSPWVVQASFPGIPGQVMERALSSKGFYISTGSACSSGRHSRPILDSMNISGPEKEGAVRFSFGWDTTEKAMDELLMQVKETAGQFEH